MTRRLGLSSTDGPAVNDAKNALTASISRCDTWGTRARGSKNNGPFFRVMRGEEVTWRDARYGNE
jgi:hypothetical protein